MGRLWPAQQEMSLGSTMGDESKQSEGESGFRIRVEVLKNGEYRWHGSFTPANVAQIAPKVVSVIKKFKK